MAGLLTVVAIGAVLVWLFRGGPGSRRAAPAPEDDVTTPIDEAELEAAERELAEDPNPAEEGDEADDDWGPGTR